MNRREKSDQRVLDHIKANGGFSVFWATENNDRAASVDRLKKSGRIIITPKHFPWSEVSIAQQEQRCGIR